MAVLQVELERMNAENQQLKEMLNQATTNYSALQMHLMNLMQNQKDVDHNLSVRNKVILSNGAIVPRQFMDLGLANSNNNTGNADVDETTSLSSSGERRSGSAGNNLKNGHGTDHEGSDVLFHNEDKKQVLGSRDTTVRENSPDQSSQGNNWGPNKVPKFNSPKSTIDQTEATMRKARVSVRARSEAPMVHFFLIINKLIVTCSQTCTTE